MRTRVSFIQHIFSHDITFICLLLLTSVIFFLKLFVPEVQLFITPDSNLSDILHFNYPLKYILSEALKHHELPMWTDLIGTGFPLIAEAEIGAFSFMNQVLFYIFPLPIAFNLGYVITFALFGIGMYLVGKELGWQKIVSFLLSIIFMFSGFHIVQIPHYNHLQTLSYMPWLFWVILRTSATPKSKIWLILPFLISQQIFQGHYQYVFISWTCIVLYWFCILRNHIVNSKDFYRKLLWGIGLGLGLSAIQLLPSYEYFGLTLRGSLEKFAVPDKIGGFAPVHLLQFLYPYILGDIRNGTFAASRYMMSFWEMFSYIGLLPILITVFSFKLVFTKKHPTLKMLWVVISILLIISMQGITPIASFFAVIPPFSWFRMQSRFLSAITFLLLLVSGYTVTYLIENTKKNSIRILLISCLIVGCIDVLWFAHSYNPTYPASHILKPQFYPNGKKGRISTINDLHVWFTTMYAEGWKNPEKYFILLNTGTPNNSILYDVPSLNVYAGFSLQRYDQFSEILLRGNLDKPTLEATLSAGMIKSLQLHNAETLLTPYNIKNKEVVQNKEPITFDDSTRLYSYTILDTKPRYFLTNHYQYTQTIDQYLWEVEKPQNDNSIDAFIHLPLSNDFRVESNKPYTGDISIMLDQPTKKKFRVQNSEPVLFVASEYPYPGWRVTVDGVVQKLYPTNIIGMSVPIQKGDHTITLEFIPTMLYIGFFISGICCCIYAFGVIRTYKHDTGKISIIT